MKVFFNVKLLDSEKFLYYNKYLWGINFEKKLNENFYLLKRY
jgi:hypothetical protein